MALENPSTPSQGVTAKVGGMLGVAGLNLSNLSTVLKAIKDLADNFDINLRTFAVPSRSWWAILLLLIGNCILFRYF